jgi:hypothetical protein
MGRLKRIVVTSRSLGMRQTDAARHTPSPAWDSMALSSIALVAHAASPPCSDLPTRCLTGADRHAAAGDRPGHWPAQRVRRPGASSALRCLDVSHDISDSIYAASSPFGSNRLARAVRLLFIISAFPRSSRCAAASGTPRPLGRRAASGLTAGRTWAPCGLPQCLVPGAASHFSLSCDDDPPLWCVRPLSACAQVPWLRYPYLPARRQAQRVL